MIRALASLKREVRWAVARYPLPYRPLAALRHRGRALVVGRDTELVIEGYPRSANTYAVAAFRVAQRRAVRLAHHLHAPAQVIWAVRRGIPALVLLRAPEDAVVSLLIREPRISASQALRGYLHFYRPLLPLRDGFVLASFETATGDFGAVTEAINRRFGTSFGVFEATEANRRRCLELIEAMDRADQRRAEVNEATVARPSAAREALKARIRDELEKAVDQRLRERARDLHRALLGSVTASDRPP